MNDRTKSALLDALNATRRHVLDIIDGLDDEALRRPVLPSGWSCLDMIKHLTYDEEIFWFRAVVAGEQEAIDLLETPAGASIVEGRRRRPGGRCAGRLSPRDRTVERDRRRDRARLTARVVAR